MQHWRDDDIYNSPAMQAALGIYIRHGAGAADYNDAPDDCPKKLFQRRRAEHEKEGDDEK